MPFDLAKLNEEHEKSPADALLQWALKQYSPKIVLASSFGAEDVVLIDILAKLDPKARVVTLDTGRLNEETYEVMDAVRRKYGISIESYFPDARAVEKLERAKGFYSFRESVENRKECCAIRKVEPLRRALQGLDAWITGLRREQSVTRANVQKLEIDEMSVGAPLAGAQSTGGDKPRPYIIKVNPLADWTQKDVWDYVRKHKLPYNRLHDAGYPSIGCAPCTRAVSDKPAWNIPEADVRKGRWWWESPDHKECGLHGPGKQP